MMITISSAHAAQIVSSANASPSVEICGLLLGTANRIDAVVPAPNVADDPARRFEVDPVALFAALRAERAGGGRVIGSYHSHPGGIAKPSAADAAMVRAPGELWLIVAGGDLTAWRANDADGFDPITLVLA